jgi:hypothetical protein
MALNHGAHGAIKNQDALIQLRFDRVIGCFRGCGWHQDTQVLSVTAANYKAPKGGRRVISGGIVLNWDWKEIYHRVDDGALKGLIITIFVVFQKVVLCAVMMQWCIR